MDQNILVSVIIPTYSRNNSLKRSIDSVLKQTYKRIEIIVVDDNPVDSKWRVACNNVMQDYKENEIVRYIQNEKNLGGAGARNVGISHAQGEYIAFLDDDDEYLPERIEKQLQCFLSSKYENLALVYCFAKFINENGASTYSDCRKFRGNCLYEAMEQNCIASTSQWMVKKNALNAIGGFPIVPCKQDSQTILKLLEAGYEVDVLPEIQSLYYNFAIGKRISGVSEKNIQGEILYRTECRKQYYKLETWQIINIEYKFAEILYYYYKVNKRKEKMEYQWRLMCKLNRRSAYLYRFKEIWHKFKH